MVARTRWARVSGGLGLGVGDGLDVPAVADEPGDPPVADPQPEATTTTKSRAATRQRGRINELTSNPRLCYRLGLAGRVRSLAIAGRVAHRVQPVASAPDGDDLEP